MKKKWFVIDENFTSCTLLYRLVCSKFGHHVIHFPYFSQFKILILARYNDFAKIVNGLLQLWNFYNFRMVIFSVACLQQLLCDKYVTLEFWK